MTMTPGFRELVLAVHIAFTVGRVGAVGRAGFQSSK